MDAQSYKRMAERESLFEMVDLTKITIIRKPYCRPVSEFKVNQIVRQGFDMMYFGVMHLSYQTDGTFAILDGQHRSAAARKAGITVVPARIFFDKGYEEEAKISYHLNFIHRPTALDNFRYRFASGEEQARDIVLIVAKTAPGMHIPVTDGVGRGAVGSITSIGAIDRAYADLGPKGFEDIVRILFTAWGQERRAWITDMIEGMRQFWGRYRTEVKEADLIDKLKLVTPEAVIREAGVGVVRTETAASAIGKAIRGFYNQYRRSRRLPEWQSQPTGGQVFYEGKRSDLTLSRKKRARTTDEPAF